MRRRQRIELDITYNVSSEDADLFFPPSEWSWNGIFKDYDDLKFLEILDATVVDCGVDAELPAFPEHALTFYGQDDKGNLLARDSWGEDAKIYKFRAVED